MTVWADSIPTLKKNRIRGWLEGTLAPGEDLDIQSMSDQEIAEVLLVMVDLGGLFDGKTLWILEAAQRLYGQNVGMTTTRVE
jgi:hypothetical protein